MITSTRRVLGACAIAALAWTASDLGAQERAAYLTLMGNDTLAIEWLEFGEGYINATALIRGSRTTFGEYHLALSHSGEITAYSAMVYAGGSADGELIRSDVLVDEGGQRQLVTMARGQEQARPFEAAPGSVPFIDMLHWPFEAALRFQVANTGGFGEAVATFTGRGSQFMLRENDDGSFGLRHPSRGWSNFTADQYGRIQTLDGTGSTRAYDLTRKQWTDLDVAALGNKFADRPLGELSGRGEVTDFVAGVQFSGDYGVPMRRGRTIFGQLLAYGVWWRTGANASTTFGFDKDITIDGEVIPAGSYSLSSIPEEDGGILIINKRTGQGGQSYSQDQDQARVRMRRSALDEKVEAFTIRVVPDGDGGRIELRWDDVVYWVPFTVS